MHSYFLCCFLSLRFSIIRQFQWKKPEPSPLPLDLIQSGKVILHNLLLSHHTPANGSNLTISKGQVENKTESPDMQNGGRRHVIIMATTRTGSSFVGEFFNQEKENMFYLFEPLWHVINRYSLLSDQINWFMRKSFQDVLQGLFHCDFSPMEKFIKPTPVDHVTPVLFRRVSSYSLCSDPVCSPQVKRDFQRYSYFSLKI